MLYLANNRIESIGLIDDNLKLLNVNNNSFSGVLEDAISRQVQTSLETLYITDNNINNGDNLSEYSAFD